MSTLTNIREDAVGRVIKSGGVFVSLAGLILSACSTTTTIGVVNPPNVIGAAKLRTVAVYPFEGRNGNIYRAEVEALLASVTLGRKPYFKVVESSRLDQILKAQKGGGPLYDESTVVKVGRLVGAQGVYMGNVISEAVNDNRYSKSVQRCTYQDRDGKCQRWQSASVPCTRRIATVAFTIRLVNIETGVQSYNRNVSGQAVSEACQGGKKTLSDREALLRKARQVAYRQIRSDVAPYSVNLCIELMDDTDGIESDLAKTKLESGLAFAKAGRMDRACKLWQEARAAAPGSIAVTYNIGVCAEAEGEFENALALYQEADRLLLKPNPVINKALVRIQKRLDDEPVTTKCGTSLPSNPLEMLPNPLKMF